MSRKQLYILIRNWFTKTRIAIATSERNKMQNVRTNTSEMSVFARRLGVERLPLVRTFLLRLNHVTFDLVTAVCLRWRPRQLD